MYENDDQKYPILLKNEGFRHEIFSDVLSSHLGLTISGAKHVEKATDFTKGYFLGRHEVNFSKCYIDIHSQPTYQYLA